jgi:hypothetical protein
MNWQKVIPEIWMTLYLEGKKWLLNERKRQLKEDDRMKKPSASSVFNKSTIILSGKQSKNSNMPNQYTRVKNIAKWKDEIKHNEGQTYAIVNEFLEEAIKTSNINKQLRV